MRPTLFLAPLLTFAVAHAAPGFKQSAPFPVFQSWAKGAAVPGFAFKEAKEEPEAYLATYAGAGGASLVVKVEGAGKFEGLAPGATAFTWRSLEAQFLAGGQAPVHTALMAVRYATSKATVSATLRGNAKPRTQADLEKTMVTLKPEQLFK